MSNYTKESLDKLGIYELRTIAREIGVYSPTLLKKDEIINKILNIINGVEEPYVKTTKQGRPPKAISQLTDLAGIFSQQSKDNFVYSTDYKKDYKCSFRSNLNYSTDGALSFAGYFHKVNDHAIVHKDINEAKIIIKPVLFCEYGLKEGDFIEGNCSYKNEDKCYVVDSIKSINGEFPNKFVERQDFYNLPYEFAKKYVALEKNKYSSINSKIIDKICPLTFGARVIVNFAKNSFMENLEELYDISNSNVELMFITVNDEPEIIQEIKNKYPKIKVVEKLMKEGPNEFLEKLEIRFEYLLRQVETGKKCIVIFNSYEKIKNYLAYCISFKEKLNMEQAVQLSEQRIKDMFLSAKTSNNGGGLSVIFNNCKDEQMLQLCNTYWSFNSNSYSNTDITLNIYESFYKYLDKLLSEQELKKFKIFKEKLALKNVEESLDILFN